MYNTLVKGGGVLGDLGPPVKLIALWGGGGYLIGEFYLNE